MNDITRKRIMRKLENLPDEVLYEIVDFIDFVEVRHGTGKRSASPLQRLAEGVEDAMRVGKLPVSAIKGTMNVVDGAGKVVEGIASAGQSVFDELQKATSEVASVAKNAAETRQPPEVEERAGGGDAADGEEEEKASNGDA